MTGDLDVDGSRPAVKWVAALPSDWTTVGERLILLAIACDSFDGRSSRPGAENLAAWTGMHRSSVAEAVNRLLRQTDHRPALLARVSSNGRNRSEYRLLQPSGQPDSKPSGQTDGSTVGQLSGNRPANQTVNCRATVGQPSGQPDPPSPSPETPSLSADQRAVANALGLTDDDERLTSVDQMLQDNGAKNSIAWIRGCAKNGDLARLFDESHSAIRAKTQKAAEVESLRCPHGVINGIRLGQCPECCEAGASRQYDIQPSRL